MRALVIRTLRLPATTLLLISLTLMVSSPFAHSQTTPSSNPAGFDPGPRNPGTTPFPPLALAGGSNCPVAAPVKFKAPNGNGSSVNCIDIDQPPSVSPQPPADGAGNAVGENTNNPTNNFFLQPLSGLWFDGMVTFSTIASVVGGVKGEPMAGLGPSFNAQSCFECHAVPAVGGTSPGVVTIQTSANGSTQFQMPLAPLSATNPELLAESDDGGSNDTPDFPTGSVFSLPGVATPGFPTVEVNGPVIEVRFVNGLAASGNSPGVGQYGVGNLFTIQGRGDIPANCAITQINFGALGANSISFRIPTPTFGLGLVESTPDPVLIQNSTQSTSGNAFGVIGNEFNTSGNDGTITRFGWKAQNKSLLIFAGEASNVEMGVTNELFPNERTWGGSTAGTPSGTTLTIPPCIDVGPNSTPAGPGYPEDEISASTNTILASSNVEEDSVFMLMNGAPSQCSWAGAGTYGSASAQCVAFDSDETAGQTHFNAVGCALCHSPTLITSPSPNASLSSQTYHPYSDFALHHMGGLDDGISQGGAAGDQFRTAPLWGIGQRLFFLHDGRATNLNNAIQDHCISTTSPSVQASEACTSVGAFNALTTAQQQQVLHFLRSL